MKKDNIITIIMGLTLIVLIYVLTRTFFLDFAVDYKILGGFIKFFILASFGDLIAYRIKNKKWGLPNGMIFKAIVWGVIGIFIVLIFVIFSTGVTNLQENSILPFVDSKLARAFFISVLMNLTFAPTMMAAHRISDTYIELRSQSKITLKETIGSINWKQFIDFTVFKSIPLFWIPAHTITFILPSEYQIIFAAILGIFLGLILGLFNNKK